MKNLALEITIMSNPFAVLRSKKEYLIDKFEHLIYRFENLWTLFSAKNPIYKKLISPKLFNNILTNRDQVAYLDPIFQNSCRKRNFKTLDKLLKFNEFIYGPKVFRYNLTSAVLYTKLISSVGQYGN